MRFGYSDVCLEHDTGGRHPESPDRLEAIRRGLSRKHAVEFVDPDPADAEEVTAVHDAAYVEEVREFCANGGGNWDPDTVAVPGTWDAALASAGLAQWTAVEAFDADGRNTPFALGRPPGHHAVVDDAMGFCFFNNVAIATEHVLDRDLATSVAILDWDVHHGNGTQEVFYDRDDVFYASIHEENIYPGTGDTDETGDGAGEGTTLNVPLPSGSGTPEYLAAVDRTVGPAIDRFAPDLLLVSAGFDAHEHDPISRMHVSTEGYGALAARVRELCDQVGSALGFVLEGGYSLDMLADGVCMVHDVFDGREPVEPNEEPNDDVRALIEGLRDRHGLG